MKWHIEMEWDTDRQVSETQNDNDYDKKDMAPLKRTVAEIKIGDTISKFCLLSHSVIIFLFNLLTPIPAVQGKPKTPLIALAINIILPMIVRYSSNILLNVCHHVYAKT